MSFCVLIKGQIFSINILLGIARFKFLDKVSKWLRKKIPQPQSVKTKCLNFSNFDLIPLFSSPRETKSFIKTI